MANYKDIAINGIVKNNPTFRLVLGMCPTLAVTISVTNGLGMGLSTLAVLLCSNVLISILRDVIPDQVRIPCYILIVATFVTIIEMVLRKYIPDLYSSLGMFIPLIVVNCIILGRAEAFASQNGVLASAVDGISMGLGFTISLTILSFCRELLGAGQLFGVQVLGDWFPALAILVQPAGGFLMLGLLMALFNYVYAKVEARG
ncbi:MAG: electron transport complex subunit E [Bacillota bacterium]